MSEKDQAESTAMAQVEDLRQDFPDIEKEIAVVARVILSTMSHMPLEELIYRALMTGATLTAQKYKAARECKEDLLTRLTRGEEGRT